MSENQARELKAIPLAAGELQAALNTLQEMNVTLADLRSSSIALSLVDRTQYWLGLFLSNPTQSAQLIERFEQSDAAMIAAGVQFIENKMLSYHERLESELGDALFDILMKDEDLSDDLSLVFELSPENLAILKNARPLLVFCTDIYDISNLIFSAYKFIHFTEILLTECVKLQPSNLALINFAAKEVENAYQNLLSNQIAEPYQATITAFYSLSSQPCKEATRILFPLVFVYQNTRNKDQFCLMLRKLVAASNDQERYAQFRELAKIFYNSDELKVEDFAAIEQPQNPHQMQARYLFLFLNNSRGIRQLFAPQLRDLEAQELRAWLSNAQNVIALNAYLRAILSITDHTLKANLISTINNAKASIPELSSLPPISLFKPSSSTQNEAIADFCRKIAGDLELQHYFWGQENEALDEAGVAQWLQKNAAQPRISIISAAAARCGSLAPRPFF